MARVRESPLRRYRFERIARLRQRARRTAQTTLQFEVGEADAHHFEKQSVEVPAPKAAHARSFLSAYRAR